MSDPAAPPRDPSLDGIRGLAIGLVLAGHLDHRLVAASYVGVGLFFVLSGYLITGLLRGGIARRTFYVHRAARLLPALAVLLLAMVAVGDLRFFLPTIGYVANWSLVFGIGSDPFAHTWSLAVEEQFYLLWPFLLPFVPVRWMVAIGLLSLGVRFGIPSNELMYYSTATRLDGLLLGSALAFVPLKLPARLGIAAVAVLVGLCVLESDAYFRTALAGTTLAGLVLVATRPRWIARLAPLGRISYSLYLYHYPLVVFFGPAGLVASIPLAWASTHYLEEPIRRWVRRRTLPTSGPAPAVVSGLARV